MSERDPDQLRVSMPADTGVVYGKAARNQALLETLLEAQAELTAKLTDEDANQVLGRLRERVNEHFKRIGRHDKQYILPEQFLVEKQQEVDG